jgi:alcohol dehydrogenase class IV
MQIKTILIFLLGVGGGSVIDVTKLAAYELSKQLNAGRLPIQFILIEYSKADTNKP